MRPADDGDGGDPVCWAHRLCPECGAMPAEDAGPDADRCWRCGARRGADGDGDADGDADGDVR